MLTGATHRILLCFNDTNEWTFAELCRRADYSPDLGAYYIRQLVQGGYLESTARGRYAITPKGSVRLTVTKQQQRVVVRPRLILLLVAEQAGTVVLLRRTIQPFIGSVEWPSGAVELGEALPTAARRIAERHFGKPYQPVFTGFFRQMEHYKDEIFDDKLFAVHSLQIPATDTIRAQSDTGKLELHPANHLEKVEWAARGLASLYEYATAPESEDYIERTYELSAEDFAIRDRASDTERY